MESAWSHSRFLNVCKKKALIFPRRRTFFHDAYLHTLDKRSRTSQSSSATHFGRRRSPFFSLLLLLFLSLFKVSKL